MQRVFMLALVLSCSFLAACAGVPKVADDLLLDVAKHSAPLVQNAVEIGVTINPEINNWEKLDDTVKRSLELALENANTFGGNTASPYSIEANINIASQSPISFGSFNGRLEIHYILKDDSGFKVLDETIFTVAGSDKFHFAGADRHRRARAVNISKNVLQFVELLNPALRGGRSGDSQYRPPVTQSANSEKYSRGQSEPGVSNATRQDYDPNGGMSRESDRAENKQSSGSMSSAAEAEDQRRRYRERNGL